MVFFKRSIVLLLALAMAFVVTSCSPVTNGDQKPYEEYVDSLPDECFPVPRECYEQALEEGQLNTFEWAEWWPEEIYEEFEKEFGIKIVRDYFASEDEVIAKFKLDPDTNYDWSDTGLRPAVTLRELEVMQEINTDWVPNVYEYMEGWALEAGKTYGDPGWKYANPTHISALTYAYNANLVDDPRVPSWSALFEPAENN
ncbi:MAG: hypothetical protein GX878_00185, partial [Firmicutes bacterium]|nr:hypothetical protein [Bacillota bacterium]